LRLTTFKISKYLLAGGFNTAVTYFLFILLIKIGIQYKLALTLDYAVGLILGYLLNKYWVFNKNEKVQSLIKYLLSYILIFLVNLILLWFSIEFCKANAIFSQLLIILIISIIGFVFQNFWVFTNKKIKWRSR